MGIDVSVITQHDQRDSCSVDGGSMTGAELRERIIEQLKESGMETAKLTSISCSGAEWSNDAVITEDMHGLLLDTGIAARRSVVHGTGTASFRSVVEGAIAIDTDPGLLAWLPFTNDLVSP